MEILLLAVSTALLFALPGRDALEGIVAVVVALLTATTNGGYYHYVWLIPFALLAGDRLVGVLVAAGFGREAMSFAGGVCIGVPLAVPAMTYGVLATVEWVVLLCWFMANVSSALPASFSEFRARYRRTLSVRR